MKILHSLVFAAVVALSSGGAAAQQRLRAPPVALPVAPVRSVAIQGASDRGIYGGPILLHGTVVGPDPRSTCTVRFAVDGRSRGSCSSACGTSCTLSDPWIAPGQHTVELTSDATSATGHGTLEVERARPSLRLTPVLSTVDGHWYWTTAIFDYDGKAIGTLGRGAGTGTWTILVGGKPAVPPQGLAMGWPGMTIAVPSSAFPVDVQASYSGDALVQPISVTRTYLPSTHPPPVKVSMTRPADITVPGDGAAHPVPQLLVARVGDAYQGVSAPPLAGLGVRFYACANVCTPLGGAVSNAAGYASLTTLPIDWRALSFNSDQTGWWVSIVAMEEGIAPSPSDGQAGRGAAVDGAFFELRNAPAP